MGMYDLRNRYYSPELGRFLQPDPIGFKGDGSNLYRYCGNDWANKTDPMGLQSGHQSSSYDWFACHNMFYDDYRGKKMGQKDGVKSKHWTLRARVTGQPNPIVGSSRDLTPGGAL